MCARCPKGYDCINPTPVGATGGRPGSRRHGMGSIRNGFLLNPIIREWNQGDLPIAPTFPDVGLQIQSFPARNWANTRVRPYIGSE
ncbi:hypothetical protein QNI19_37515 [Cytophagaceae bacterium DM2B3-1]|uniref:Uncharacterized protein n=1 Tax=Xanthocytophaga flava TaxID=3048013 RepID=A0ABT7CY64_9BACT|nr:hypothetical protein [Xanthocytophaga flavus]MDJ1498692.1 hypothetical protein [Xanthocytophaga flavus]